MARRLGGVDTRRMPRPSRRRFPLACCPRAGTCLVAVLALAAAAATWASLGTASTGTRRLIVRFRGPGGWHDSVLVALPAWYGPHRDPPLPLVVSPHSRGLTPSRWARRWGDLPGRFGLIVLDPGLHGRVIPRRSWAWPPDIAELARLPELVHRRLPWLRYDPHRVYAAGDSMGGQETLMLLARQPDLFAAAVAADPVTNLLRRWYEFPLSGESWREQQAATREVGGTPRQARWLYVRRSPVFFARTIAFAGVPLELWWNPQDTVVVGESTKQTGFFYRTVERLDPHAPVVVRLHHHVHGWVFKFDHDLPAMLRFLLAHRRHGPPPTGFAYTSWLPRAAVWGWRVQALGSERLLWTISHVTRRGLVSDSPRTLLVRPPFPLARATLDGRRDRVTAEGALVPPGRHRLALVPVALRRLTARPARRGRG